MPERILHLGNYMLSWERIHFKQIVEKYTDIEIKKEKIQNGRVDYLLSLDGFYKLEKFWVNDLSKRDRHKYIGALGKYLKTIRNYERLPKFNLDRETDNDLLIRLLIIKINISN